MSRCCNKANALIREDSERAVVANSDPTSKTANFRVAGHRPRICANVSLDPCVCSLMNGRLKWSVGIGLVLSVTLEITSAAVTALHPTFTDHPEVPHPIFLLLLFP